MPAIFITGTGSGVGKTFVTASLARHWRVRGSTIDALKPVVSGFDPAAPSGSDPAVLLEALGKAITPAEWERISPWRFRAPLSPDMAARLESRTIEFEAVVEFCKAAIAGPDIVLIEGIGGLMVPLDQHHTVLDWMTRLEIPIVLVGGTYLGSLSHMLTAQDVLLQRRLDLRAIVISETQDSPVPLGATLTTLRPFAATPLLGLGRQAKPDEAVIERLAQLALTKTP